jgi:hypothetical protein
VSATGTTTSIYAIAPFAGSSLGNPLFSTETGLTYFNAGNSGQVFTSQGANAAPAMATPAAASGGVDPEKTYGGNLIRNYPSLESADGAQPEWWEEEDANVTLTEEDATGASIPQKHERVLKIVNGASGANKYVHQDFDDSDEPTLDDNVTKISAGVWVYQDSGDTTGTVKLELYDEDGAASLGNDTTSTEDAWTFLKVENVTYQDSTQFRLSCDTNSATFYAAMPMMNVGEELLPWQARGLVYIEKYSADVYNQNPPESFTDVDFTASTSNITAALCLMCRMSTSAADGVYLRRNGSSAASGNATMIVTTSSTPGFANTVFSFCLCDDSQIVEVMAGSTNVSNLGLSLKGYYEWE